MSKEQVRYTAPAAAVLAEGWTLRRLTPPSRLYGANGLRTGADGRIYVAQVTGSQVSAIDIETGQIETISPMGGDIIGPDDLAFDAAGNLFVTEFTEGRVSVRAPGGATRVVNGEMPGANPITVHQGRLIAGELRPAGRIMELDLDGGAPRVILDNAPMVNGFEVGPDGLLYFPVMATNEIWRIGLDGGAPEVVAKDLGVPDALKFDAKGFIVSTQVATGDVLRIDPRNGGREVLATIAPGLDNLTFVGDRIFVSSISGQINEVLAGGVVRPLVPDGLAWPLGLAMGEDGRLLVADGGFFHSLLPGERPRVEGMIYTPGYPGYVRGVAAAGPGDFIVTTGNGQIARWRPTEQSCEFLAQGFERLYGVALAPGGAIVFADGGAGRVLSLRSGEVEELASGLKLPMGVAIDTDGTCYVSESAGGRVVKVAGGRVETVLDGLIEPQGLLVRDGRLYVVDVGAKALIEYDPASGARRTIAANLPVGAPAGIVPKLLNAIPPYVGPMVPFADIAAGADGVLFVSGDAEGSVLALRPA